jgi:hypothetical protein
MNDLLEILGNERKVPQCLLYTIEITKEFNFTVTLHVINKEVKIKNKTLEQVKNKLVDILPSLVQYEKVQMRKMTEKNEKD